MSQHRCKLTQADGRRIEVMLGYDRILDYVFMTVFDDPRSGDILYCNMDDPEAGLMCRDLGYFRQVLSGLEISLPESMFSETLRDQQAGVGNREVDHTPQ